MHNWDMEAKIGKRIAKTKLALTKRAVEGLKPADKSWIAWDDRLTGFGVRVHPTHCQLPVRRWWTEGTQQARRHRPLRESCS